MTQIQTMEMDLSHPSAMVPSSRMCLQPHWTPGSGLAIGDKVPLSHSQEEDSYVSARNP